MNDQLDYDTLSRVLRELQNATSAANHQTSINGNLNAQVVKLRGVIRYAALMGSGSVVVAAAIIAAAIWWG